MKKKGGSQGRGVSCPSTGFVGGVGGAVLSDDHNPANKPTNNSQTLPAAWPSLFLGASPLRRGRARTQGCERSASPPLTGLHVHLSAVVSAARPPPHAPPSNTQPPSLSRVVDDEIEGDLEEVRGPPRERRGRKEPRGSRGGSWGSQLETKASFSASPPPLTRWGE